MPKRIQRKRTKGWRMPDGAVYVGRPTVYGNPFTGPDAASQFRTWWEGRGNPKSPYFSMFPERMDGLMGALFQTEPNRLRGHDLACWCPLCPAHADGKPFGVICPDCAPCHADPLGEIANG